LDVGLAGAAQIIRIDRTTHFLRQGKVIKTTHDTAYGVTSLWPDEADPDRLLDEVRGYWAIETKQHYRRDHTQREDHCQVRHTRAARNLSLMRSMAIFLFERQRRRRGAKLSLPDWQHRNVRQPRWLIQTLMAGGA
jgi:predicted transposase YbfD/YdcC